MKFWDVNQLMRIVNVFMYALTLSHSLTQVYYEYHTFKVVIVYIYCIWSLIKKCGLTNKRNIAARFSFLKPSTLKAANSISTSIVGTSALRTSNKNVPSQYEVAPTPLTNWMCFAYESRCV